MEWGVCVERGVEEEEGCEGRLGSSSYSCLKDPPKRKHHLYKKTYLSKWRPPRSPSRPTSPASGNTLCLSLATFRDIFGVQDIQGRFLLAEKQDSRNRDECESHVETIINHPRKTTTTRRRITIPWGNHDRALFKSFAIHIHTSQKAHIQNPWNWLLSQTVLRYPFFFYGTFDKPCAKLDQDRHMSIQERVLGQGNRV